MKKNTAATTLIRAVLGILLFGSTTWVSSTKDVESPENDNTPTNPFLVSDAAFVKGPTVFPKPTDLFHLPNRSPSSPPLVPYIQPIMGTHRPEQDAVLLFASEYKLDNYALFIESLRATGFTGDIVMVIHPQNDWQNKPNVREYLQSYSATASSSNKNRNGSNQEPRVVVYAPTPECFNMERERVDSSKGGSRTCVFPHLYGTKDATDGSIQPVPDPRPDRTVANIRYELYWIMALQYHPYSWIMLVDARDTVFQSNPFTNVPRRDRPTEHKEKGGLLYFFGENRNATRIGLSKQNNRWIRSSYGDMIGDALAEKPTICSGATLGEQVALEMYLRAMVAEADETGVVLVGSDQGFHNRLYYSSKLVNAPSIQSITVFDQGAGIVNNMGAMRTKPLQEWGNGRILEKSASGDYTVKNWDGLPSPVVHQFDRHKELSEYFFKQKTKDYLAAWRTRQQR